mgnify:CR=1 FL=1
MDAEMIILCDGVVIPQSKKEIDGGVAIAGGHILRMGRVRNYRIIWEWIRRWWNTIIPRCLHLTVQIQREMPILQLWQET